MSKNTGRRRRIAHLLLHVVTLILLVAHVQDVVLVGTDAHKPGGPSPAVDDASVQDRLDSVVSAAQQTCAQYEVPLLDPKDALDGAAGVAEEVVHADAGPNGRSQSQRTPGVASPVTADAGSDAAAVSSEQPPLHTVPASQQQQQLLQREQQRQQQERQHQQQQQQQHHHDPEQHAARVSGVPATVAAQSQSPHPEPQAAMADDIRPGHGDDAHGAQPHNANATAITTSNSPAQLQPTEGYGPARPPSPVASAPADLPDAVPDLTTADLSAAADAAAAPPPPPMPPVPRPPPTGKATPPERKLINLALLSDGASIVAANREAKRPEKTIDGDSDSFMKNECGARKWVMIELSQMGTVERLQLTMRELYSSRVREFEVRGRQSHPRKEGDPAATIGSASWEHFANFTAENRKGTQSFALPQRKRARHLLLLFHSHYGSEDMCAMNGIEVMGVTAAQELEEALSQQDISEADAHPEEAGEQLEAAGAHVPDGGVPSVESLEPGSADMLDDSASTAGASAPPDRETVSLEVAPQGEVGAAGSESPGAAAAARSGAEHVQPASSGTDPAVANSPGSAAAGTPPTDVGAPPAVADSDVGATATPQSAQADLSIAAAPLIPLGPADVTTTQRAGAIAPSKPTPAAGSAPPTAAPPNGGGASGGSAAQSPAASASAAAVAAPAAGNAVASKEPAAPVAPPPEPPLFDGGSASKPKQAGNLFDVIKQNIMDLKLIQTKASKRMESLERRLAEAEQQLSRMTEANRQLTATLEQQQALLQQTLTDQVQTMLRQHLNQSQAAVQQAQLRTVELRHSQGYALLASSALLWAVSLAVQRGSALAARLVLVVVAAAHGVLGLLMCPWPVLDDWQDAVLRALPLGFN